LEIQLTILGGHVPGLPVLANHALAYRTHEKDRPDAAQAPPAANELFQGKKAVFKRCGRGAEQQSQSNHEKIVWLSYIPHPGTRVLSHIHQILAEFLEAMEFGDFLLGFAPGGRVWERFGHRLAGHSAGKTELGIMTRIAGFGAMAGRLSTAPDNGGNRPRPEVAQAEEIFQDLGAASRAVRSSGIVSSFRCVSIRSEIWHKKRKFGSAQESDNLPERPAFSEGWRWLVWDGEGTGLDKGSRMAGIPGLSDGD
jgi:hypothetical protein